MPFRCFCVVFLPLFLGRERLFPFRPENSLHLYVTRGFLCVISFWSFPLTVQFRFLVLFHLWTLDVAPNLCRFTFLRRSSWISRLIVPFRVLVSFRPFGRFVSAGGGGGAPGLALRGLESLCASRQASDDNGESGDRLEFLCCYATKAFFCVPCLSRVMLSLASFAEHSTQAIKTVEQVPARPNLVRRSFCPK